MTLSCQILFQYAIRRLIVRSHEISKPSDWWFELSNHFEIDMPPGGIAKFQSDHTILNTNLAVRDLTRSYDKTSYRLLKWGPCRGYPGCANVIIFRSGDRAVSKIKKTIYMFDVQVTFTLYDHFKYLQIFIHNETTFTKWISKLPGSFEIHRVRQYLVNFMDLTGMTNANVYKTEPIFTGLGHANCPNLYHCLSEAGPRFNIKTVFQV